jgi:hypothetical protein
LTPEEWLAGHFQRCSPWLQGALDRSHGTHELKHVWEALAKGSAQLWPLPNSAVVTAIEHYPTGITALRYWLAGGDLNEILGSEQLIESWAKERGCTRVVINGRRGWLKALKGYHELHTAVAKEI